jgi:hypothetical protein
MAKMEPIVEDRQKLQLMQWSFCNQLANIIRNKMILLGKKLYSNFSLALPGNGSYLP